MATKKKAAAAAPVDVPEFLLESDGNKTVGRAKASLAKKWSLSRMESLLDASYLAWFLVALGRAKEAREIVDYVADRVPFDGNHNLWSPASNAVTLAARLARLQGDEARRASLVSRVVEHPAVAAMDREALVKWIAGADKDVRSAEVDPSQKWALQGFARGCARATYFRETAAESGYEAGVVDIGALENTIGEGLAGLRAHLAR
ncbi:MAG TPA: DUF6707 family protein [Labilithrix sp.]|nr:DUF6707 family protein [Labilithrix sp.]